LEIARLDSKLEYGEGWKQTTRRLAMVGKGSHEKSGAKGSNSEVVVCEEGGVCTFPKSSQ
jgi:hypothetical protein